MRKRLKTQRNAVAILAASLFMTGAGRAQPRPPVAPEGPPLSAPDGPLKSAELRARGDAAAMAGRDQEALEAWRAAWLHSPSAGLACSIGSAELAAKSFPAAAQWLHRCVQMKKDKIDKGSIHRRRIEVSDLAIAKAHVGTIFVETEPGALVTLDAAPAPVGVAPLDEPIFVEPGFHQIEVRKGGRVFTTSLIAIQGREHRLELPLGPAAAERQSHSPFALPMMEPPPRSPTFIWWPTAVGGALAAGLGTAFHVMATSARSDEEQIRTKILADQAANGTPNLGCGHKEDHEDCGFFNDLDARRTQLEDASTAALLAAGAFSAVAVGYALLDHHRVTVSVRVTGLTVRHVW